MRAPACGSERAVRARLQAHSPLRRTGRRWPGGVFTQPSPAFRFTNLDDNALVTLALEIMPHYQAEAKKRMLAGVRADPEATLPQGSRAPQARDQAAAAVGLSVSRMQSINTPHVAALENECSQ